MEPYELTFTEASDKIASRELSPVELTESSLKRIREVEPDIHAYATITEDLALEQARVAEKEIAAGKYKGPLHGIPLGVKDLYDTRGILTTSSSDVRADYIPDADSASVQKLTAAGMVIVGKTHTHEFAFGATTPTTRNPWDISTVPGGSSGGSGASIASGGVTVALGSDTGGSIRIPASVCGTVGIKPTYGRAPRVGVASLSWSLDHVGPLTRNVREAALVMAAMSGYDRRDPASVNRPVPDWTPDLGGSVEGTRIGIPTNFYNERVQTEIWEASMAAAHVLEGLGAELVEVEIPLADKVLSTAWTIMLAEAGAYHQEALRETPDLFTDEVRTLLEVGEGVLATSYINALRTRTLMQQGWREMYADIDVLLAPTLPGPAVGADDPVFEWAPDDIEGATTAYSRVCAPGNLTGLPALSMPVGYSTDGGLPLGAQVIGKPFCEGDVLRVASVYETATDHIGTLAPLKRAP
ncbi:MULTISPECIES: amidase [unclassified Dietzia]|uniref:amidase n=1 Tax=unclassified Dietzia TaxID=2617939 RepID=UPI0015FAAB8D|nr:MULTISPECIES: amidase [unclassified Dietzia]MBB1040218.1 Asp-tRNA(Asn)/Glu-tRNA(Gln) amidotransferase GatCAB subunit A [Dietzia sp. Cai40]MBB1043321.1 Asp-tRNA(Asn)/Glu-tRNA(Gln) amidotransferase GatCAB subunit A [Dietzia sp. DQ11-44]